jgi:hypothetical protein
VLRFHLIGVEVVKPQLIETEEKRNDFTLLMSAL